MDDNNILWPAPPVLVSRVQDKVHVWAMSLQVSDATLNRFSKLLSPAERRRAEAFHFDRDRNRFIAGRGAVRTILGRYLQTDPAMVELTVGSHGKPLLAGRFAQSGLHFNLAHCEDLAVLAVARGCVVGIDLEWIRAVDGAKEMAEYFCSPRENAEFQSLPPDERQVAFFRLWTRKEAWLKATGKGIGESLQSVEISFGSGQAACFLHLPEESGPPANGWSLRELTPAPGFIAALALPEESRGISCWQWKKNEEEFEYA